MCPSRSRIHCAALPLLKIRAESHFQGIGTLSVGQSRRPDHSAASRSVRREVGGGPRPSGTDPGACLGRESGQGTYASSGCRPRSAVWTGFPVRPHGSRMDRESFKWRVNPGGTTNAVVRPGGRAGQVVVELDEDPKRGQHEPYRLCSDGSARLDGAPLRDKTRRHRAPFCDNPPTAGEKTASPPTTPTKGRPIVRPTDRSTGRYRLLSTHQHGCPHFSHRSGSRRNLRRGCACQEPCPGFDRHLRPASRTLRPDPIRCRTRSSSHQEHRESSA
ncbi:hypothetical protein MLGJGCBP_05386 [Rhodococcus sp. T7]|nr:hypothetical protein MLGJGCBP_09673 [Rhodococcus sp. T7]KAF0961506.1 hypothetical protein MLGJGCBP_05386 [Rhodococcus sp. T7]